MTMFEYGFAENYDSTKILYFMSSFHIIISTTSAVKISFVSWSHVWFPVDSDSDLVVAQWIAFMKFSMQLDGDDISIVVKILNPLLKMHCGCDNRPTRLHTTSLELTSETMLGVVLTSPLKTWYKTDCEKSWVSLQYICAYPCCSRCHLKIQTCPSPVDLFYIHCCCRACRCYWKPSSQKNKSILILLVCSILFNIHLDYIVPLSFSFVCSYLLIKYDDRNTSDSLY